MNYSLFIMVMKKMMSLEAKGQSGVAHAASPLLFSDSSDLYCVFFVYPLPHHEIS
jgi:hypothetical protein